jgi:squalene-hopene/tetraprenyl-beta-curcumene cyclase
LNSQTYIRLGLMAVLAAGLGTLAVTATAAESAPAAAAPAATPDAKPLAERCKEAMARGFEAILKEQAADGSWGKPQGSVGVTALITDGLLEAGKTAKDPAVAKALAYLLKAQKEDGGIYDDAGLRTYATSISALALLHADAKGYAEQIKKAEVFMEKTQWGADESIEKSNPNYGGIGYGKSNRPDMSNTSIAADMFKALEEAGVPHDSQLWSRMVVFASRSQDRSESNDGAFAGTDSGGGIYSPVESKAEMIELPDGRKVMRTYGSMTYAVLKAFVFANLSLEDGRVKAAMDWIRKNWTFEENPGMGQQGLYYYYMTAARTLTAYSKAAKTDKIVDARRRSHEWKTELAEAILKRQRPDGAWLNDADRWFEGYAPIPTSYCLIALAQCQ